LEAYQPCTYLSEQRSEVVAAALTNPLELDLPFARWTRNRLQVYLNEYKGSGIKRSRRDQL